MTHKIARRVSMKSLLFIELWNWIEAPLAPGVAATQTFGGQPPATKQAMAINCFDCVIGTMREEPATRPNEWANGPLINSNQANSEQLRESKQSGHF